MRTFFAFIFTTFGLTLHAQDIVVHDPVMIKDGAKYYLFCTGMGISVYSSTDMKSWQKGSQVFTLAPSWIQKELPDFKNHMWAPDVVFHNGLFYLFYSVSAFGKNTSCIGVATNKTLDPANGDFEWKDHGKVIQSIPGRDLWNAIDPNVALDENNQPWLSFGSFWSGIKLVKLDSTLTRVAVPQQWFTISKRPREFNVPDENAGKGAVEAPFIFRKDEYYYLFLSFDYCCRGKDSTYKIVVGRSKNVRGPYADKNGVLLTDGGGSLVLEGDDRWAGLGHNSAYTFNGKDYLIFHAYDNSDHGKPKLKIEQISWKEGWPVINGL